MTFGSASVDPTTQASYGSIALWDERNEPALRALADGIHGHGALCMSQMTHMGRRGHSLTSGVPLRAPSDLPEGSHLEVPVPLDADELPAIVERFAAAARRLEQCGWDGAEVTSFGGHLIEQFFDPQVNTRTDAYGGSLENRTRFGREVLEAVRAAVSDDFIVGLRMAVDQCLTGGLGPEDMIEIARSLTSSGPSTWSASAAAPAPPVWRRRTSCPGTSCPEGVYNERAARFRHAVGVPVLVAGRNVEPEVGRGRPRGRGGPGRHDPSHHRRPGPAAEGGRGGAQATLHQPQRGLHRTALHRAADVVLGEPGDPRARARPARPRRRSRAGSSWWVAGSRAWRPPAPRRCAVTASSSSSAVRTSAAGPGSRPSVGVASAGGCTSTGSATRPSTRASRSGWAAAADVAAVLAEQPDAVILATGSRLRDEAPPSGTPLLDVDALLEHGLPAGGISRALVLDDEGGFLAPTAAEALVAAGCTVEIATTHTSVGALIDPTQQPFVLRRLALAGVVQSPNLAWVPAGTEPESSCSTSTPSGSSSGPTSISSWSPAVGRARRSLRDALRTAAPELPVTLVGDALAPRTLLDAVAEGARAGATIEVGRTVPIPDPIGGQESDLVGA